MPHPKRLKESKGDKAIVAAAGVDNTHRRTWDVDEYEERAAAREEKVVPSLCHPAPIFAWGSLPLALFPSCPMAQLCL